MSVVSFDGHDGFPERGFAEALLCGEEAPIRSHGKSFLGSEKKTGCLFREGLALHLSRTPQIERESSELRSNSDLHDVAAGE